MCACTLCLCMLYLYIDTTYAQYVDTDLLISCTRSAEFARDYRPIDSNCTCEVCKSYTRAYLHTIAAKDALGSQLLTYHNIAYQMQLMKGLRDSIMEGNFTSHVQQFMLAQYPQKNYPVWARDALASVQIDLL